MNELLGGLNGGSVPTLELIYMLTLLALLPSLVIMMTSFTRTIIILSFTRNALGVQQTPPNMVLVGMALFLTLFTMGPVLSEVKTTAYDPYVDGTIGQEEFFQQAVIPLKSFMARNTQVNTLQMFCDLADVDMPEEVNTQNVAADVPLRVVVPAFITCELQRAFFIGLLLYIPFMLIDIVVSCTLMSMGMIMLPPSMISAPFKLLLFVTLNGWELLFSALVRGVN